MNKIVFAGTRPKTYEATEHSHKCWEVIYCLDSGEVRCGDSTVAYKRGQAVVIPPLIKHNNLGAAAGDKIVHLEQGLLPFKKIAVIEDDKNGGLFFACAQAAFYHEKKCKAATTAEIPFLSPLKSDKTTTVATNTQRDMTDYDGILSALGDLIVAYTVAGSNEGKYSPVVQKILIEMDRHLSDSTFSLEDYMRTLPLNYDYMRKLFKSEIGVTAHDYFLGKRMQLAASFLANGISNTYSAYSVAQIAESCGFADPLYFSRVFKKHFGVPPSEYKG